MEGTVSVKLLNYYKYILSKFRQMTGNLETAEDYTQELFAHAWKNRHYSRTDHVSMSFINLMVKRIYYTLTQPNRAIKRQGELVSLEECSGVFAYHDPYIERIFTRELLSVVGALPEGKLKTAIIYFLTKGELTKSDAKYWEMIKYNRTQLQGAIC